MAPFGDSIPNGMEWNEMEKVSGDTGSGKTPRWYGWRTYRRTDGRTDVRTSVEWVFNTTVNN